jgi:hypothetical protein
VKEILLNRLGELELSIFKPQSIEYLARKVSLRVRVRVEVRVRVRVVIRRARAAHL